MKYLTQWWEMNRDAEGSEKSKINAICIEKLPVSKTTKGYVGRTAAFLFLNAAFCYWWSQGFL